MIKFKSFFSVVVLSIILTSCGSDSGDSGPQQLSGDNPNIERGMKQPEIVGVKEDNKLAHNQAEKILNGEEALIIDLKEEVNESGISDGIIVQYEDRQFKCGEQSKVEGQKIHCMLQPQDEGTNRVTLTPGKSKFVVIVKQTLVAQGKKSEEPRQDYRQEVKVSEEPSSDTISLVSGEEQFTLDSAALANFPEDDSVIQTYKLNINGAVDENEIKQAIVLLDPLGNERAVQDVTVTQNAPADASADKITTVEIKIKKSDLMVMDQDSVEPTEPTEPAPEGDASADDSSPAIFDNPEVVAPAEEGNKLLQGTFKLLLKQGLKIGEESLSEDFQIAAIEVKTEEAGTGEGTETPVEEGPTVLQPAGDVMTEDNKIAAKDAKNLVFQLKTGEIPRSVFNNGIDASSFSVQEYEADFAAPKGDATNPQSVQVVDPTSIQLNFAEEGLRPGFYEIKVEDGKLKDESGAPLNVEAFRFEVIEDQAADTGTDTVEAGDADESTTV